MSERRGRETNGRREQEGSQRGEVNERWEKGSKVKGRQGTGGPAVPFIVSLIAFWSDKMMMMTMMCVKSPNPGNAHI